jgi:outer membrane protein TolC
LQALRNVADVLRALDNDAHTLNAQTTADASAQESMQSTRRQYDLGAASYLQILVAQQQVHQIRISLSAAQARRLLDTVALYQAMGGGLLHDGVALAANSRSDAFSPRMR